MSENETITTIDPEIKTIEVDGKVFYSKDCYVAKFGEKTGTGRPFFSAHDNGFLWLSKKNGAIVLIKLNDSNSIQIVNGATYITIDAYPS